MDIPLLDHFFGLKINPLIIFLILLPLFSALISGCFLATVIFLRLRSERVTPKDIVDAIRALDAQSVEVSDLVLRRPTLDDVFLSLTGHMAEEAEPAAAPASRRRRRGRDKGGEAA